MPTALAVGLLALAMPAQAHTTLLDSGPASGQEVNVGTELIALQFGEVIDPSGDLEVAVLDKDESPLEVSASQAGGDGSFVCTRVEPLEPGVHTVRYEVTSADGHVVRGNYQFSVAEGGEAADPLACEIDALPEPSEAKSLSDQDQSDFPEWALWTIGGVVVVTAALAVVAVMRSRRDEDEESDSDDNASGGTGPNA